MNRPGQRTTPASVQPSVSPGPPQPGVAGGSEPDMKRAAERVIGAVKNGPTPAKTDLHADLLDAVRARVERANYCYHHGSIDKLALELALDADLLLAALDEARAERDKAQRAAKTLGGIVDQNARMILDITGLHDWIDEDGDGDWGAIWENAYELRPQRDAATARADALAAKVERCGCEVRDA